MTSLSTHPHARRREVVWGALVVALFTLVFLWRPIASLGERVFAPADFSQSYALTRVESGIKPANPALRDVWATHQPWLMSSRRSIESAVLPTWDGFSGGGSPHLANPQTAVLSPFSFPYYFLDLSIATILSSFLKLFALGFFTFLFLRELRLAFSAAIVGAVIFMFAGHQVTGLFLPQSGTAFVLPAGLFLVERLARAVENAIAARTRSRWLDRGLTGPATGLAACLALGFFAGAVDTFAFCVGTILLFALARFVTLASRVKTAAGARRELAVGALHVAGAFVVGGLASGIVAVPYLEALRNARAVEVTAESARLALSFSSWPLFFFPDLLGNPSGANFFGEGFPKPEYASLAAGYVGFLGLFLALLGVVAAHKRRVTWFFGGLAALALATSFGALGTSALRGLFPAQAEPPVQRAFVVLAFAIAVLAGAAVDRCLARERAASRVPALLVFSAGFVLLTVIRWPAQSLLARTLLDPMVGGDRTFHELASNAHIALISALSLVGVGLVASTLALQSGRGRAWAAFGLALVTFAQTGWLLADYNPLTKTGFVYPRTVDVDRRVGTVRSRNAIVMGDVDVPPATNQIYGVQSFAVNDPLRIRRYDQLQRRLFEPADPFGLVTHTTSHALEVFSIECVYDEDRWVDVDTEFGEIPLQRNAWFESAEILPGAPIEQRFTGFKDGIEALQFMWIARDAPNACAFSVTLDDPVTGERLVGRTFAPGEIVPRGGKPVPCVLLMPPNTRAKGRTFVLRIATEDARPGHSCAVGCRSDLDWLLRLKCARIAADAGAVGTERAAALAAEWKARQGNEALEGQLALDMHYSYRQFEYEDQVGPFALFHDTRAPARFHSVGTARVVESDRAAWEAVLDERFDARAEVVLEAAPPGTARTGDAAGEIDARVEVLRDFDGRVQLVVQRKAPGFVVTPIAWYPGWKARVNNAATPVLCANYAFTAVAVPAGESLVDLEFEPKSVRNGTILSVLGFVGLLIGLSACVPARRARPRVVPV